MQVKIGPQAGVAPIGQFHHWVVQISNPDGTLVFPARISIGGGMLGHKHGLPTQPQVTKYLGDGRYLIEGLKFNMNGAWTIILTIQTPDAIDRVSIPITLDY